MCNTSSRQLQESHLSARCQSHLTTAYTPVGAGEQRYQRSYPMISPRSDRSSVIVTLRSALSSMQILLYRLTGGSLGSRFTWGAIGGLMGSGRILLLTTTERTPP